VSVTAALTGLTAGTTYYYEVRRDQRGGHDCRLDLELHYADAYSYSHADANFNGCYR